MQQFGPGYPTIKNIKKNISKGILSWEWKWTAEVKVFRISRSYLKMAPGRVNYGFQAYPGVNIVLTAAQLPKYNLISLLRFILKSSENTKIRFFVDDFWVVLDFLFKFFFREKILWIIWSWISICLHVLLSKQKRKHAQDGLKMDDLISR